MERKIKVLLELECFLSEGEDDATIVFPSTLQELDEQLLEIQILSEEFSTKI